MQVKVFHALRRSRPDRCDAPSPDLPSVIVKLEENIEKRFDAVRTREHDPIIDVRVLHQLCEFAQIARRLDADRGQFDHVRAERPQLVTQHACLLSGSRNDNSFSQERPLFVPIQTVAQPDDFAKHGHRRCFEITGDSFFGDIRKRARESLLLAGCGRAN